MAAARAIAVVGLLIAGCSAPNPAVSGVERHGASGDASVGGDAGASDDGPATTGDDGGSSGEGGAADGAAPPAHLVAYASGYGPDIDVFSVDPSTGALTLASSLAAFGTAPSFLAVDHSVSHLYAVDENAAGRVGAYAIDGHTGALTFLNAVSSGGNGPPFVSIDATGRWVFVANYGDGTVSVLPVQADGSLGAAVQTLSVGAEAHMIIADPTGHFVFVPCKGADYVAQFLFDASTGTLTPNVTPHVTTAAGAGPRHIAFHPNGRFVYLINETNSTMTAYALDSTAGTLSEIQTVSTLPAGFTGTNTGAEVWVHPSGQWVLGSNRGADSIAVFAVDATTGKLTLHGSTPSGGATPRDFTLDPSGAHVYAADQGSGVVAPFRFDASSGSLSPTGTPQPVASASFVGVVPLPH
jgi:6-phosphogluconolactonase